MSTTSRTRAIAGGFLVAGWLAVSVSGQSAQPPAAGAGRRRTTAAAAPPTTPPPPPTGAPFDPAKVPAGLAAPKMWTTQQDHQNMKDQLGIKALRPGPSGNESAPNHANYDEATANPYPESARRPHAEERQEGHERRDVGGAAHGDRRGLRSRSARPRPEERAEGDLDRDANRRRHGRRTRGRRQAADRPRGQLRVSGDRRRYPDDARDADGRQGSGARDDDVRRRTRCCPAIRLRPAAAARPGVRAARPAPILPRPSS